MTNLDDLQEYEELEQKKDKANKCFLIMFTVFIVSTLITIASVAAAALSFGFSLITFFVASEIVDMMISAFNMLKIIFPIEVIIIILFIISIVQKIHANKAFKRMQEVMGINIKSENQDFIDAEYRNISDENQR